MVKSYSTIIAACLCSVLSAQQNKLEVPGTTIGFTSKATGLPLYVSIDNGHHVPGSQFAEWMQREFIKSGDASLHAYKTEPDQLGMRHTRYHEYYKGYELDGSLIVAHEKNNDIVSFSGEWFKDIVPANSIALSEKQALAYALQKVNAKRYKWENTAEEAHMREALGNPNFSYKPVGETVLVPVTDAAKQSTTYHYAYKFNIYAEVPLSRAYIYVDASTGAILKQQSIICTADAVGSANTKYSGTQSITTDSYSGGYRLREAGRGGGIETYNLNNSTTYTNTDFTNTVNTWTVVNNNQAATDAHWGAEKTYDFYYTTYSRNSVDNAGYKLLSYVHYDVNYVNAFWDGTRMTYGDGDVSQGFYIMTALDVCGHEITHGVVQNTAGLNGGGNGEPDALNEGFADIFGTTIEAYARPTQHDWIMGKDISTTATGIRDMSNPKSLQQPDTYQGQYWDNTGEPHTNNGPCIYWYYLLCVGGSGSNDNSQSYNVTGITMAEANAIAYRAMTVYMTPSTTYADVRNYTIQAAKDLYGGCSNEVIQTTNAWYAVGVGAQYTAGTISPAFTGDLTSSCSLPATVNFSNSTANGSTYTWRFGDGTTSNSISPSHTYSVNGTYTVKLVAVGCTGSTSDSITKTSYITVNAPSAPTTTGANICNSGSAALTASASGGTINWYNAATGGTLLATGGTYNTPNISSTTTYYAVNTVTQAPVYGGPATNTAFGAGSNFNANAVHYEIFDVHQPCTLKSVVVYANSAGNRIIELRNSSATVLQTATVNVAAGTQTVTLNFPLTPGTSYQLGLNSASAIDLYRNSSGSGYPYNIGSMVSITGCDVSTSYYYFFYNWQVQQAPCQSTPVAATAVVNVCTGIQESSSEQAISLFPNPASSQLTFSIPKDMLSTLKSIEIYDALGKQVKAISISSEQTQVEIADLAHGVYTCRIINTSNERMVKRFIKE